MVYFPAIFPICAKAKRDNAIVTTRIFFYVFNIILTVVFLFFCFPVFDPVALYFPTGNRCWSAGLHKIPRGTRGVTVLFCVSTLQLNH